MINIWALVMTFENFRRHFRIPYRLTYERKYPSFKNVNTIVNFEINYR
jgi:hypothetical protein